MSNPDLVARWTGCRAAMTGYLVAPLVVPIILAIALAGASYALN